MARRTRQEIDDEILADLDALDRGDWEREEAALLAPRASDSAPATRRRGRRQAPRGVATEDDPTVQACIDRCMSLGTRLGLQNRRARREANRDEINRQNRESRHRREQGAALLQRVERAVVREENRDDPCEKKLRRLQELVDRLQMDMERPERVQPQRRPRGAVELEEGAPVPRLRPSDALRALAPRIEAAVSAAATPRPSPRTEERAEARQRTAQSGRLAPRPRESAAASAAAPATPEWVRDLLASAQRNKVEVVDSGKSAGPGFRKWLKDNGAPAPSNQNDARVVARYLNDILRPTDLGPGADGRFRHQQAIQWVEQHGPRMKALWQQISGGALGGASSDDLAGIIERIRDSGFRIPPGLMSSGTPAERLERLTRYLRNVQTGRSQDAGPRRESGRLPRQSRGTAEASARVPRNAAPDVASILSRAQAMGYSLPPGFTPSGASSTSQLSSMFGALQVPERASITMDALPRESGRMTAQGTTVTRTPWYDFVSDNYTQTRLSATYDKWAPGMLQWLKSIGYPLNRGTKKATIVTARYLALPGSLLGPKEQETIGFTSWRDRYGDDAQRAFYDLSNRS